MQRQLEVEANLQQRIEDVMLSHVPLVAIRVQNGCLLCLIDAHHVQLHCVQSMVACEWRSMSFLVTTGQGAFCGLPF